MCILLPGNLYLRGAVAVLNRPNSSYFPQAVVLVPTGYARQPLPHKGARLPGGRLGVFIARLTSARRPAPPPYGRARRCGGLPPGSASPPRPSRGLARSGVPPSRLGRAVGAFAPDYPCGVGFALRFYGGWRRRGAYKVGR